MKRLVRTRALSGLGGVVLLLIVRNWPDAVIRGEVVPRPAIAVFWVPHPASALTLWFPQWQATTITHPAKRCH